MTKRRRGGTSFDKYGYAFIAPFTLVFLVLHLFPILYTLLLGFTDYKGMSQESKFVGLENFHSVTWDAEVPGFSEDDALDVMDYLYEERKIDADYEEGDDDFTLLVFGIKKDDSAFVAEVLSDYGIDEAAYKASLIPYKGGLLVDSFFWKAFANNWIIWSFNFVPQLLIALLIAVIFTDLRLKIRGGPIFKPLFYLPNILNTASVAVLFATLLYWPVGPINQFLAQSGLIPEAINFFRSAGWSRGIVAFIQFWMWYGTTMIILIAGIAGISPSLYEAAYVDGANGRQMFFHITLPLLKPVMLYVLVTSLIGGMQMFDIPYLLTNRRGDPDGSIMTTPVYIYIQAFTNANNYSYASAVSFGLFLLTLMLSLTVFFVFRDKDDAARLKRKGAAV
ncbi:MAG: sugar ABC transporter permease [Spirochaetia bacterium]|jgi:multiple sugar transport system permease protein|nr:sugar ABC transporter permease [Spirochaetia bacterium]